MNRHERRKKRSQERKARRTGDTMGPTYQTVGKVPPWVENHPAFKRGLEAGKSGTVDAAYMEQIERAAKRAFDWIQAQPSPPDLRWVRQKDDGVFLAAALCDVPHYLADSPDAFRLLAALDEGVPESEKLSLNMAVWALRRIRAIPMPDGSYYGVKETSTSEGYRAFQRVGEQLRAHERGESTDHLSPAPCGHCGKVLDGGSSARGQMPKAGDLSLCIYCGNVNQFDADMKLSKLTEEQLDEYPEATRDQIREMQALLRSALARSASERKGPVAEA